MSEHEASRSYQPSNTGIAAYYQADGLALRLPRVPSTHHLHGESPAEEVGQLFICLFVCLSGEGVMFVCDECPCQYIFVCKRRPFSHKDENNFDIELRIRKNL